MSHGSRAPEQRRYDVVIAGGGLAGLCLALELSKKAPDARLLVVEKNAQPPPEAAHKVGESSVEVGSHYFVDRLGLADVLGRELPKFGLRFFMSDGENLDIASRLEVGPSHYLYVPSFQIDRGRFERELAAKARAARVELLGGWRVARLELRGDDGDHQLEITSGEERSELWCRWLVDASGRASLLKKQLDLARDNRHDANAAWFRIDAAIDLDEWSDEIGWGNRVKYPRRLSTNHLLGDGYWVWLIPLTGDRTSVGIVGDAKRHPFSELHSFDKAMAWLERHEPQCASIVRAHADERMDFLALKNYSHDVKQIFSGERWCVTGDAGLFIDPLYSPGNDFIGISNGFITDLVRRDLAGEEIAARAEAYDQSYRAIARTYLVNYQQQYRVMGSPRVMATKIVWDFVMYWGSIAQLFFRDRLCDTALMERVRPTLRSFAFANVNMQAFFRKWAASEGSAGPAPSSFVDYAELPFLAELNRELQINLDDDQLVEQLNRNLELTRELKLEILLEGSRSLSKASAPEQAPTTVHLGEMFAAMRLED